MTITMVLLNRRLVSVFKQVLYSSMLASFAISVVAAKEIAPANVEPLSVVEQDMLTWIDEKRDGMLEELRVHVEMNTGSGNIAGIDAYRALLQTELEALGFSVSQVASDSYEIISCEGGEVSFADHLVAGVRGKSSNRLFLNGHMDTVFSIEDDFQQLTIDESGVLHGPGVGDMKGGIVVMLNALRALKAAQLLDDAHMTILLNSDEELGSLGSRPLIEELASEHDIGLVFEGTSNNQVTRARKGLGQSRIKITGRESHAGAAHEQGVSANLELAHKIIKIEGLTDYDRNTTVNVGVMAGGEKRNTVPGCADAFVDLRYPTAAEGKRLKKELAKILSETDVKHEEFTEFPQLEHVTILHRPVKALEPKVDAMIAETMGIAELVGDTIEGTRFSGGGTDGSIAQASGLPTLDSLGVESSGIHSSRETASFESVITRTKLAAVFIARQIEAGMTASAE